MNNELVKIFVGFWIGIFVNVLVDILPANQTQDKPICLNCFNPLPNLIYFLGLKCSNCGKHRFIRYWGVIFVSIGFTLRLWMNHEVSLILFADTIIYVYFATVFVIDLELKVILHSVSIFGALFALGYGTYKHGLLNTLLGGSGGFLILLSLYYLGVLYIKKAARKNPDIKDDIALGYGDVNLTGVLGLLLGWPGITGCIFLAVIAGGIVSGLIIVTLVFRKKYSPFIAIPYGPFLIISASYLLFYS